MGNFITPPNHFGFKAKKISKEIEGDIIDCSIAYIEPGGGGPEPSHAHNHDHFFIVVEGTATIIIGEKEIDIKKDESIMIDGKTIHSIHNRKNEMLKMIGVTINP